MFCECRHGRNCAALFETSSEANEVICCPECGKQQMPKESVVANHADYPTLKVRFFDLERFDDRGGSHKSVCPACGDGLLLMTRSWDNGTLLARDSCTLCGQEVEYEDIARVRRELP